MPLPIGRSALLFARDLLVAFLIVGLLFGAMTAYARNWPPVVVVESGSMAHSRTVSSLGVIDTGDIVLVEAVRTWSDVMSYADGRVRGHQTYESYGDVIVFYDPRADLSQQPRPTPIIHRAMLYVLPNGTGGADVPSLVAWPSGSWSGLDMAGQSATVPYGLRSVTLLGVKTWSANRIEQAPFTWDLRGVRDPGFLTKGDHNPGPDEWGGLSVEVSRVIGKASGELAWFGLIKLTLSPGESGCCRGWGDPTAPKNSWDALLVSLIVIILGPFAVDFAWGFYADRRRARGTPMPSWLSTLAGRLGIRDRNLALVLGAICVMGFFILFAALVSGVASVWALVAMVGLGLVGAYFILAVIPLPKQAESAPASGGSEGDATDEAQKESAGPGAGNP